MKSFNCKIANKGFFIGRVLKKSDFNMLPDYEFAFAAEDVNPADLLYISNSHLKAVISCKGSTMSHAAIIADNQGLPFLICPEEAIECIYDGCMLVVNGYEGVLIVNPDDKTIKNSQEQLMKSIVNESNQPESCTSESADIDDKDKCTDCGIKIRVNYGGTENLDEIISSGADGIGIFRTEFKFMDSDIYPSEEEQYAVYAEVAGSLAPKEVIIRTFDLGSDKKVKWLKLPKETNPALGLRGIRVMLENRDIFSVQLKALLRASVYGNIKIMFPMLSTEWEMDEIKKEIDKAAEELEKRGEAYQIPPLGIMMETPASVLYADKLAEKADFFSIGTNDLSQYTFAIDRESNRYDNYTEQMKTVLVDMIERAVNSAHKRNISIGICGQLASDPELTGRLLSVGADELSVPIGSVNKIRNICRDYLKNHGSN